MANSGRKKIVWTEDDYKKFEGLCSIQCTQDEICSVMGVTDKTLMRLLRLRYGNGDFSEIYKKFSSVGKASLRRMQFKSAEGGNVSMQIWLGKQMLGQKDQIESNPTDPTININVTAATAEDVDKIN